MRGAKQGEPPTMIPASSAASEPRNVPVSFNWAALIAILLARDESSEGAVNDN